MNDRYATDAAFREALEQRLKTQAMTSGVALPRIQRRVTTERLLARLQADQPGTWVLKGGMALDARLGVTARSTKDLDLGLRMDPPDGEAAVDMLSDALRHDLSDRFAFAVTNAVAPRLEVGDMRRATVECRLSGRPWGSIRVDIGIRAHELDDTEHLELPGTLRFASIEPPIIETVTLPRHIAEKLHAMTRDLGDRENTRTRDLVDVVLLADQGLIDIPQTATAVRQVFHERDTPLPTHLPLLPTSWADVYEASAEEHDVHPRSFADAIAVASALWTELFPGQEKP